MRWVTLAKALDLAGGNKEQLQDAFAAEDVPTRRRIEDRTVQNIKGRWWVRGAEIDWERSFLNVGRPRYESSKPPAFVPVEVNLCNLLEWLNTALPPLADAAAEPAQKTIAGAVPKEISLSEDEATLRSGEVAKSETALPPRGYKAADARLLPEMTRLVASGQRPYAASLKLAPNAEGKNTTIESRAKRLCLRFQTFRPDNTEKD
jgi:hypothetical protein